MESGALISAGVLLIVAGLALLAASIRISRLARGFRARADTLLRLAGKPIDPLDIPSAAWPALSAGGWQQMQWEGSLFGNPVSGTLGEAAGSTRADFQHFDLASGEDVILHIRLSHQAAWGEQRLFAEQLARIFLLLLETRLHARSEAIASALAERARLSLFLQHDIRNLAQWILWMNDELAGCDSEDEFLMKSGRLKTSLPHAGERARRLIDALAESRTHPARRERVDLAGASLQSARLAGLEPAITGTACAWVARVQLGRVLDSLFGSLAPLWRSAACFQPELRLAEETGPAMHASLCFTLPEKLSKQPAERLCDPFMAGRIVNPGFSLYQARKIARSIHGDLHVENSSAGMELRLILPARAPL